jgi:hypothetical protein
VKFADSKKQIKLKFDNVLLTDSPQSNSRSTSSSATKVSDFWLKQQMQLQQQQSMMYTYPMQNGSVQQQQLLPVPLLPYGGQQAVQGGGSQHQQQIVYIPNAGYFSAPYGGHNQGSAYATEGTQRMPQQQQLQPSHSYPSSRMPPRVLPGAGLRRPKALQQQQISSPEMMSNPDVYALEPSATDVNNRTSSLRPPEGKNER